MLKLGILCSGGLGYKTASQIINKYDVKFILTDKGSISIIEFCKEHQIPYFAGNPRKGKGFDFIKEFDVDIIASINYLFLIEEDIIAHPKKLAFNIHGSLLPKYRGRTPHVWSIINNEKETGITAHKIEIGCDTGAIIEQIRIPIEENNTGADILKKYGVQYVPLVERVLQKVENETLKLSIQDESKATYFGKRTPDDGQIDWNWSKERIRNWVRAQADPYPGAFTFYKDKKVIIDKVEYCEKGFNNITQNGTILQVSPKLIIKTSNGALSLENIRGEKCIFVEGNKLDNENRK
ncbi:methionyl-tRNA formyltransferase [Aquimarina aggregata]|uniref:methionyl-tRNA formyltransferase n=1 Tax=Aquimarina aggregata TaxID=1642818 RepID=UPI002490B45C|nr:methionyl-tRNA formyltransferase [Aquimarina aggregata]